MTTIVTADRSHLFWNNRLLRGLTGAYCVLWTAMAIAPVDRIDWLLENLLVFAFCALLVYTYRLFRFSELSYFLFFVFLSIHAVGAHYTYGQVPLGYWLKDEMGLDRNYFDRIAHFSYGLLFAYPIREMFLRTLSLRGLWPYYFAIDMVLAFSAFFELLEGWIAQGLDPALADKYLGTQGDLWDAQNDVACALAGALIACSWMWWQDRRLQTDSRTSSR